MQSATLKHSRADTLPSIGPDNILQVYTHKSLRRPGLKLAEYDDNERLSVLGAAALEMAVLDALMGERPMLSADELEVSRDAFWSNKSHINCRISDASAGCTGSREHRRLGLPIQHARQNPMPSRLFLAPVVARGEWQPHFIIRHNVHATFRKPVLCSTPTSAPSSPSRASKRSNTGSNLCSEWSRHGRSRACRPQCLLRPASSALSRHTCSSRILRRRSTSPRWSRCRRPLRRRYPRSSTSRS